MADFPNVPSQCGFPHSLGLLYYEGRGIPRDYAKALSLYRDAATGGNAKAMNNLGIMYGLGEGVEQRDIDAYAWFALAARNGDQNAAKNRDLTSQELGDDQLRSAQQLFTELGETIRKP